MLGQSMLRQHQTALCNSTLPVRSAARAVPGRRCVLTVKAEQEQVTDRRAALGMLAGVAALVQVQPSHAAFGDAANVFGKPTNTTGLIPYKGKGFTVNLPSRWTPSHEQDVPGVILRYEDTGDQVSNVVIFKVKGGSVSDPKAFLKDNAYMFGQNVWQGSTISEGGFKKDQVSAVDLIDSSTTSKDGKQYLKLEVFTRTADGTEGGRHNLVSATSSGGDLWVCRVVVGDKRWFRGAGKFGKAVYDSFAVA